MKESEFPNTVTESQKLIEELLKFAEIEQDREKRRELLLMSIELKAHISKMKKVNKKTA